MTASEVVSTEAGSTLSTAMYIGGGLILGGLGIAAAAGGGSKSKNAYSTQHQAAAPTPTEKEPVAETNQQAVENPPKSANSKAAEPPVAETTNTMPAETPSVEAPKAEETGSASTSPATEEEPTKTEPEAPTVELAPETTEQETPAKTEQETETPVEPLPAPILTFQPVTGEDVINAEEAKQPLMVSGTVQHLQENDRLLLKIGEVSYPATVENGRFSAQVSGATLAVHGTISAEVVRGDKAVEAAGASHSVEVKTELPTKPTVQLNPIAEDNVINFAESRGEIVVSGVAENAADGDEVIIACGCPLCAGSNWHEVKTTVQAGGFSVKFANGELLGDGFSVVTATIKFQSVRVMTTYTAEKGADTFIFNSPLNGDIDRLAGFNPNEDNIELALSVFNTLTSENLSTQIHYDAESGALSYSAEDNPVHFADLPSGLNIEPTWFVLA